MQDPAPTPQFDGAFLEAVEFHRAGKVADAERLYRQVLQDNPRHAESLHLLGVIAVQLRRFDEAVELISQAIAVNPENPTYHSNLGNALQGVGKFDPAVASYDRALALKSDLVEAHNNRANALVKLGRLDEALGSFDRAIALKPDFAAAFSNRGNVLRNQGKLEEAIASYDHALSIDPRFAGAWNNRAIVERAQGRLDAALASFDRALEIAPGYAEAHVNRAGLLHDQGRLEDAVAAYERALALNPQYADAYNNNGNVLRDLGRYAEALVSFDKALAIKPDVAEAHNNRGTVLRALDRRDEAIACYERALAFNPNLIEARNNLASQLIATGKLERALDVLKRSLHTNPSTQTRHLFIACMKRLRGLRDDRETEALTIRALVEPWGRPSDLSEHCIDLLRGRQELWNCVSRAVDAWPRRLPAGDLFGAPGAEVLGNNKLLCSLLESAPVCDADMEFFLTMARHAMLEDNGYASSGRHEIGPIDTFFIALARQCFANEYVYATTEAELQRAGALRGSLEAALQSGADISIALLIAAAAYVPLGSIPNADRLLGRTWPEPVMALLEQQVTEPLQELALRTTIPSLTTIEGAVSSDVQRQYEENPYPRWVKLAPEPPATNIATYLARKFPSVPLDPYIPQHVPRILIAGCGTGQHPIGTAQRFPDAEILAVDLSRASLAYAVRKTRELGLTSINYAQADLTRLDFPPGSFDVIESVGVLHHLADPWAGWRALLPPLRAGGYMKVGLYSAVARRGIVGLRNLIAEKGYGSTASEIRRFRGDLMSVDRSSNTPRKTTSLDFYSTSGCRDLLFHVQEHQMALGNIGRFLHANSLKFLGFDIDVEIIDAYKLRFPNDRAATNLGQWRIFEEERPSTFAAMYQFWIQKAP